MHPHPVRYARSRAALGAGVALGIVVLACDVPTPEMLAPDGTNTPTARVFGTGGSAMPLEGVENIKRVVARHFPSVARGEGESAVLFVVRSSAGEVLLTEVQAASAMGRTRAPRGSLRAATPPSSSAGQATVRRGTQTASAALPAGIGALAPDDIAGIHVSKHAEGVVAPKAVSLIVITLKPGAAAPTEPAGQ